MGARQTLTEQSPTRSMVVLLVLLPFILTAGTVMTLGWGGVLVLGVMIFVVVRLDP